MLLQTEEMLPYANIKQGSQEWHALRLGKITGSGFNKLLGTSEARKKYLYDRASEIVTGKLSDSESFTSIHIERGHEFESLAKMKYTMVTFNEVEDIGFVELNKYVGCSPDGFVGKDGMIEIKVPDSNNYFRQIVEISSLGEEAMSKDHLMQMQFNMYVCQREWCDYVLYNLAHEKNNKAIFVYRVIKNESVQQKIQASLSKCIKEIEYLVNAYHTANFNLV